VQKLVDNTGGGTKQPGDFPLFVDGTSVTNNQQITPTVGPHTVSETADPNYTAVIGGDCAANGSITLAAGRRQGLHHHQYLQGGGPGHGHAHRREARRQQQRRHRRTPATSPCR
jgi:hypothetical protein